MRSVNTIIKLLLLVIVISGLATAASGGADEIKSVAEGNSEEAYSLAPLNPSFVEYQEQLNKKENTERLLYSSPQMSTAKEGTEAYGKGLEPAPQDFSHIKAVENAEGSDSFPPFYDLRAQGKVSPVKDQKDQGSCWTFGTYASLESYLLPSECWDFSENNMKNLLTPYYAESFDSYEGGFTLMSTAYLARWSGPAVETDDPYDPHSSVSPEGLPVVKHVQEVLFLPDRQGSLDNDNIKLALQKYGAVASSMYVDFNCFDALNNSYYYTGKDPSNHLVAIVGWDDSFDKNKFYPAAPGDGAFIVKNSWGPDWGEEGYFYISYYDSKIGKDNAVFTAENLSDYDYIYQYDPLGWVNSFGYAHSTSAWASNVFTAEENETLSAVSFYTTDSDADYEAYIYIDPVSGPVNPDGPVASLNGTFTYAGYHTVRLDQGVPLEEGQNFSVVLRLSAPDYGYPVALECPVEGYSSQAYSDEGESYVSSDGLSWADLSSIYENANVCIKAFTDRDIAPEASFVRNVTSGSAPLTVSFFDASRNSPTAWEWDFGDGTKSTEQNPVHTYTKAGLYTVTLSVENEFGANSISWTDCVSLGEKNATIYVDADQSDTDPNTYSTIQEAVDSAAPGSTIIVRDGWYYETVNVDKPLTILSESGPKATMVQSDNPDDCVFYVTANSVTISGFTIIGAGDYSNGRLSNYGIFLYYVNGNNICNNILTDNLVGILLYGSSNNTVQSNYAISNSDTGIYLSGSNNNNLYRNIAISNIGGIALEGSGNNKLRCNAMGNNAYNLVITDFTSLNDIDTSNKVDGKYVYHIVGKSNLEIDESSRAGAVFCIDCQNVTVRDLDMENNYFGVLLCNTSNFLLENNIFANNYIGMYLLNSGNGKVINNNADSNTEFGFLFENASENTIENNTADFNYQYGLYLLNSCGNTLQNNTMSENYFNFGAEGLLEPNNIETSNLVDGKPIYFFVNRNGIELDSSSNAGTAYFVSCQNISVSDLSLERNDCGIYLSNTSRARLENNSFSDNVYGIYLKNSKDGTIVNNNASYNAAGIYVESTENSKVTDNILSANGFGIFLNSSGSNSLLNNSASDSLAGVYACESDNNTFTENLANYNFIGVYLESSDNNKLIDNNASENSYGINLAFSNNNTLDKNIANLNYYGLSMWISKNNIAIGSNTNSNSIGTLLWKSENNNLINNTVLDNMYGVCLQGDSKGSGDKISPDGNTLKSNLISNSSDTGILVDESYGNLIYSNYINNTKNVEDKDLNAWNSTEIGNYWSDYEGQDADGDGIGDTPYVINNNTGSMDYLPAVSLSKFQTLPDKNTSEGPHPEDDSDVSGKTKEFLWVVEASKQNGAGSKLEFSLNSPGTGIPGVSFEPWEYSTMTASVDEELKESSSGKDIELVADLSRGMNLLAGSKEFANSESIKKEVIEFRVSKSWIEEKNIDISSVILKRFHEGAWISFKTVMTGEDEKYYFFVAESRTSPGMQL